MPISVRLDDETEALLNKTAKALDTTKSEILKGINEPLITTWPVLTEAFYLLGFSWRAQDNMQRILN